MQLTKLIPSTLVFCICLNISLFAQQPSLITTYSWDATSDLWQTAKREIYTSKTENKDIILTQIWDESAQSWIDWTRTTTVYNSAKLVDFTRTEKVSQGEFIPVIEKYFSFDDQGRLLEQQDLLWKDGQWIKLYREQRDWSEQAMRRMIYKASNDNQSWILDETYEIAENPATQEQVSMRFQVVNGDLIPVDRQVIQTHENGRSEQFASYLQGEWLPISSSLTSVEDDLTSISYYLYDAGDQAWQPNGFKKTFLDQLGRTRDIQEAEVNTSFEYDTKGRLTEVIRTKPVDEWYLLQCNSCGGNKPLPQEVLDARLTREVYQYADEFAVSQQEASFEATLFPNPTQATASIQLTDWVMGEAVVQIRDIQGRLVQTQRFENTGSIQIERNNLVAGAYFVRLMTSQGSKQMRLLIID